jgi:hypothetical protein
MNEDDITEGSTCPIEGCNGIMGFNPVEGCYCHISPPCSCCVDNPLVCMECGEELPKPPAQPIHPRPECAQVWQRKKPNRDLGDGKRVFDYDYRSDSGSTMEYSGCYEGPVTATDIIKMFGDGTFGHRGPYMSNGRFTYTKITD